MFLRNYKCILSKEDLNQKFFTFDKEVERKNFDFVLSTGKNFDSGKKPKVKLIQLHLENWTHSIAYPQIRFPPASFQSEALKLWRAIRFEKLLILILVSEI